MEMRPVWTAVDLCVLRVLVEVRFLEAILNQDGMVGPMVGLIAPDILVQDPGKGIIQLTFRTTQVSLHP
jgi:hypothetical protein